MKVDDFIDTSIKFLEANPSTTISITYSNESKKSKNKVTKPGSENSVKVKCFDPHSGKCIRFKTYKAKEVSKLLTFLGPRGVSIQSQKGDNKVEGLASIMSNKKFEVEEIKEVKPVKEDEEKKKKKKKKGKK